jgi:hypothetical protein
MIDIFDGCELSIDADALLVFVFVPLQAWYKKMVASLPQCKDHDSEEYKVRTKHCYCCMHAAVCVSISIDADALLLLLANVCVFLTGVVQEAAVLPPSEHVEGKRRVQGTDEALLLHAHMLPFVY